MRRLTLFLAVVLGFVATPLLAQISNKVWLLAVLCR